MVAAAIRTIFAQPQADMVRDQLGVSNGGGALAGGLLTCGG